MSSDKWQEPEPTAGPLQGRSMRLTAVFVVVIVVGLAIAWVVNSGEPEVATIGRKAPRFVVSDIVGDEPIDLADLVAADDRPIVLNLMASWCGPCREEIPELSAFADENPDVRVIGVAVEDSYQDLKQFVSEVQPTYTVAFDDGPMRSVYQTLGLPATFFLDSDGVIVDVFNGILDREIIEEMVSGLS